MTSVLTNDTLVLNRGWMAIATTPVRHAMTLLFTDAARAINPETFEMHDFPSWAGLEVDPDADAIRTVSGAIRVPEVIVLTRFQGVPRQSLPFTRRNLVRRDQSTCQYCGSSPGLGDLSIDHVMAPLEGRRDFLGELRARLRTMQSTQGQQARARGRHASPARARRPQVVPHLRSCPDPQA